VLKLASRLTLEDGGLHAPSPGPNALIPVELSDLPSESAPSSLSPAMMSPRNLETDLPSHGAAATISSPNSRFNDLEQSSKQGRDDSRGELQSLTTSPVHSGGAWSSR
jgi:hypothetical protein